MPGTYALLSKMVSANMTKSGSEYTLSSNDDDALIYYTTDAKHITFDRSAEDQSTESYLFNGQISELTRDWTNMKSKLFLLQKMTYTLLQSIIKLSVKWRPLKLHLPNNGMMMSKR